MNFVPMKELETARLNLRRLRFEDLHDYYERITSDGDVTRYLILEPHQDIGETLEELQNTLECYEEGGCYRWGIALKEDDSLIGVFALVRFDKEAESCSFAYMLSEKFWGRGYGTEALRAGIDFAFEDLKVSKVEADHFAENEASGAVMRRCGMKYVRTQKEKYEKNGAKHDAPMYCITRNDWENS